MAAWIMFVFFAFICAGFYWVGYDNGRRRR